MKIKKLNEISIENANEYSEFNPYHEIKDIYLTNNKKFISTANLSIKKYKGYRFMHNTSYKRIYMLLPDRDYVIGAVRYYEADLKQISIAAIDVTMIHSSFRGKGLGKILYQYIIASFPIFASDETLTKVSLHLWEDLLLKMKPSGLLCIYDEDHNILPYNKKFVPAEFNRFIFFRNKSDFKVIENND